MTGPQVHLLSIEHARWSSPPSVWVTRWTNSEGERFTINVDGNVHEGTVLETAMFAEMTCANPEEVYEVLTTCGKA